MEYWDCHFNKVTRKKARNIKQINTAILTLENPTLSGDLLVPCSIAHIKKAGIPLILLSELIILMDHIVVIWYYLLLIHS